MNRMNIEDIITILTAAMAYVGGLMHGMLLWKRK